MTLNHYFIPNKDDIRSTEEVLGPQHKPTTEELVQDLMKKYWEMNALDDPEFILALKHCVRKKT